MLSLTSRQRVELNLSESHLCTALRTLAAWTADFRPHFALAAGRPPAAGGPERRWPYVVRNETGCALRFWAGRASAPPADGPTHLVAADGEKPFAFAAAAGADDRGLGGGAAELHAVSLLIEPEAGDSGDGEAGDGGAKGGGQVVCGVPVDEVSAMKEHCHLPLFRLGPLLCDSDMTRI